MHQQRNLFLGIAGPLLAIVWFMTTINGLWGYIFDGLLSIKSPSITLMFFAALGIFFFNAAWNKRPVFSGGIGTFALFFLFLCYLALAAIIQSRQPVQNSFVTIFTFVVLYLHLFGLWFSPTFNASIPRRSGLAILLVVGVTMALIGTAQHFMGDFFSFGRYIIAKIGSPNSTIGGEVRANAFFLHGDDLGVFLSFVASICVAALLTARNFGRKILLLIALVALAVGCYATLTRTAYLSFALSVSIAYLIATKPASSRSWLTVLPLALFLLGAAIYNAREIIEGLLLLLDLDKNLPFIASSASIEERISITKYYITQISDVGLVGWLFGLGWSFRSNPLAALPIDNGYLASILNAGIIGLIFWLGIMWLTWISIVRHPDLKSDPLLIGAAAFFSQFMFLNIFGTHLEPQIVMIYVIACMGTPLYSSGAYRSLGGVSEKRLVDSR